jgi:hypothetical protein
MQANFDARTGAAGGLTASIERKQPEARKDRWMLELERAAMAEGAANRAPRGAPAAQAPLGEPATAAPAGPAAKHATAPAAPAQQDALARQDTRAQQAAPAHQEAPGRAAHRPGGVHGTAGPTPQFGAGAHWSIAAQDGKTAASAAGWVAALAAGGASLSPSPSQQAAPAATALLSRAPAAGLQLALASAAPPPPTGATAEAASGQEAPAAEAPAPGLAPEGEEYARSLLHVFRAEDGVHAWLRDASLSGEQVRRVASAMAGELALAGTPLSALTVNGRRILSPGAAGDQPGRHAAGHPGEAPAAPLTPFAFKGA